MLLNLPILFLLILVNGIFAMTEMALIAARRSHLQAAAAEGNRGAQAALALLGDTGRFLSTVSIGVTVISILVATVGGDTFVQPLVDWISTCPLLVHYARPISILIVVLTNSFLSLVVGELVPKRAALRHPEAIAIHLARLMSVFSRIVGPAEWVLSGVSAGILRALPFSEMPRSAATDEEIRLLMREGAAVGEFQHAESNIVHLALRLGDRSVGQIMTPRTQVDMLDLEDGWEANREIIRGSSRSRFPVIEGSPDKIIGILQVKDLALAVLDGGTPDLRALTRPPVYVPNTAPALKLLETLRTTGAPLALVVDEYGDLDGIVTMHGILQVLVGDVANPDEEEDQAIAQREDGSWLIAGLTPVDEIKDAVGIPRLPDEDSGDFHTLGGFVMARMKRVPRVADHFEIDGWRFEVMDMDGHRVDRVLVSPPEHATQGDTEIDN